MFEGLLDFIFKLLGPGLVVGVLIGAAIVFGWDRRPANWPDQVLQGPFGFHVTIGFGDGYPAQIGKLQLQLDRQSAAVRAQGAAGVVLVAKNRIAVSASRGPTAAAAKSQAAVLHALDHVPPAEDDCARSKLVDQAFLETLQ